MMMTQVSKKSKKWLILISIILIIAGGIYYLLFTGKTVNAHYTKADYNTFKSKLGIDKPELFISALTGDVTTGDPIPVKQTFTEAEVNAFFNEALVAKGMVTKIGINFVDDKTIEISAVIGNNVDDLMELLNVPEDYRNYGNWAKGKVLYVEGSNIEYKGNNLFQVDITNCQVGQVTIPEFKSAAHDAFNAINNKLPNIKGFKINTISFGPDGVDFDGTVPDFN